MTVMEAWIIDFILRKILVDLHDYQFPSGALKVQAEPAENRVYLLVLLFNHH